MSSVSNVINLDDVLKKQATFELNGEEYVFPFDDASARELNEMVAKADAYTRDLTANDADMDDKPVADQVKFIRDAHKKQHEIVMAYFVNQIGKEKALKLYNDLNKSTQGLMFVAGAIKRASDKAFNDAVDATYPAFDSGKDND